MNGLHGALQQIAYKNLFQQWLQSHQQQPPQGYNQVQNQQGAPPNYFLKPEDMMRMLNAISPYDLYNKPDATQKLGQFDYPTSALNIRNLPNGVGIQDAIMQASQNPQNQLSSLQDANSYTWPIQAAGPQAIYAHEVGHFQDPRLNNRAMWSYPNRGRLTYAGQSGGVHQREMPGYAAEGNFWDNLRRSLGGR